MKDNIYLKTESLVHLLLQDNIEAAIKLAEGVRDGLPCQEKPTKGLDEDGTRQSTHGDFPEQAKMAEYYFDLLKYRSNFDRVAKHVFYMIATKLARIRVGNPYFLDHWEDIIGYLRLYQNYILTK